MTTPDMDVPDAGSGDFTPVRSSKSPVKKAGALLAALGILMLGIGYWAAPWVILAWPLVLILAIAAVFGTPLLRTAPPVLIIDETGVYDARIMNRPMPWSDISAVKERQIRSTTLFMLKTERWDEWMKRRIFLPERVFLKALDLDGIAISARGLDYSTEGLRDTFAQAKAVGLLKP